MCPHIVCWASRFHYPSVDQAISQVGNGLNQIALLWFVSILTCSGMKMTVAQCEARRTFLRRCGLLLACPETGQRAVVGCDQHAIDMFRDGDCAGYGAVDDAAAGPSTAP